MQGVVEQVSLSRGGLPKAPVPLAFLTLLGFEGDSVAHPTIHGGPLKAALLVTSEALDELRAQGYPVFPGALGENLTLRGLDRRVLAPGTRLAAGDAVMEVTTLRAPCASLDVYGPAIKSAVYRKGMTVEDPRWGLGGFYTCVLETGLVRVADTVRILSQA
ncbi:MAG TPA: MOSC domain-containing protein [Bryobacteraceae bacterium]